MPFISTVAREDAASSSSTKDDYLNPSSIKSGQKVRFKLLAEEPFMFYELWGNEVNNPENVSHSVLLKILPQRMLQKNLVMITLDHFPEMAR